MSKRPQWNALMNVNLKGVWLCMKYEIPAMLDQGGGAIVNPPSIYALKPSEIGHAPYCASKFGVIGLSKTAAIDYGQTGIRINVVAPGAAERYAALAARHPATNRLGRSEETAKAITWLCSHAAGFVNGAVLTVDGGRTVRQYSSRHGRGESGTGGDRPHRGFLPRGRRWVGAAAPRGRSATTKNGILVKIVMFGTGALGSVLGAHLYLGRSCPDHGEPTRGAVADS
ncbi:MAG TPA: SDR family oxidoreductase [Alphaproteobacteria bacterium]|nr:SDR family oxidoreductase [Alphaproteobacteria bacterium]